MFPTHDGLSDIAGQEHAYLPFANLAPNTYTGSIQRILLHRWVQARDTFWGSVQWLCPEILPGSCKTFLQFVDLVPHPLDSKSYSSSPTSFSWQVSLHEALYVTSGFPTAQSTWVAALKQIIFAFFFYCCCLCGGAGNQTQDLEHPRQTFSHWAKPSSQNQSVLKPSVV